MIKLIIFDFDDTLIDNDKLDYQSFVSSFKEFGLSKPTLNDIIKYRKKGLFAEDIIKKYLKSKKNISYLDIQSSRQKFLKNNLIISHFKLKKNLLKSLKNIKNKKIDCFLCSSRDQKKLIIKFLKQKNFYQYFSKYYFKDDLGIKIDNSNYANRLSIKIKLLKIIINESNFRKNEILFIGNSKEDLLAAEKNKLNFIYFQNSYLPKAPIHDNMIVIDNMLNLKIKISEINKFDKKLK